MSHSTRHLFSLTALTLLIASSGCSLFLDTDAPVSPSASAEENAGTNSVADSNADDPANSRVPNNNLPGNNGAANNATGQNNGTGQNNADPNNSAANNSTDPNNSTANNSTVNNATANNSTDPNNANNSNTNQNNTNANNANNANNTNNTNNTNNSNNSNTNQNNANNETPCPGGAELNACGVCGLLEGTMGAACGDVCGDGTLECNQLGLLECVGATESCVEPECATSCDSCSDNGCCEETSCGESCTCQGCMCDIDVPFGGIGVGSYVTVSDGGSLSMSCDAQWDNQRNRGGCTTECAGENTTCDVACTEDCELYCSDGARCDFDCADSDHCVIVCNTGASCLIDCSESNNPQECGYSRCTPGQLQSCGGGIQVCNRACP